MLPTSTYISGKSCESCKGTGYVLSSLESRSYTVNDKTYIEYPHTTTERCKPCYGSGLIQYPSTDWRCSACQGKGNIRPAIGGCVEMFACPACNETGLAPEYSYQTCATCNGKCLEETDRWLPPEEREYPICEDCSGMGQVVVTPNGDIINTEKWLTDERQDHQTVVS